MYTLDADIQRYYYSSYLSYFDLDGDGIIETYLWDVNGDGLYEKRMWYDPKTRNLRVSNNRAMVGAYYPLEFPQAGLALEDYAKLTALYKKTTAAPPLYQTILLKPEPAPPIETPLLVNGSMETARSDEPSLPVGWSLNNYNQKAQPIYADEGAKDGRRCIGIQTLAPGARAAWVATSGLLVEGRTYRLSGWFRASLEPRKDLHIRCIFRDGAQKTLQVKYVRLGYAADWTRFEAKLEAPKDSTCVGLYADLLEAEGSAFYDGFRLEEVAGTPQLQDAPLRVQGLEGHTWKPQGPDEIPVVMADIAHALSPRERTVLDLSPTGFSRLLTAFSRRPCLLSVNKDALSPATLGNVDILLLTNFSREKALTPAEIEAVNNFVERGGTLLLALNETSPQAVAGFSSFIQALGVGVESKPVEVSSTSRPEMLAASHYAGEGVKRWMGNEKRGRLYFRGIALRIDAAQQAAPLLRYDSATLAVMREVGRGRVYIFGAGDLISNAFSAFRARLQKRPVGRLQAVRMHANFVEPTPEKCDNKWILQAVFSLTGTLYFIVEKDQRSGAQRAARLPGVFVCLTPSAKA